MDDDGFDDPMPGDFDDGSGSVGGLDPLMAGTAYALFRHGQDQQTQQLVQALQSLQVSLSRARGAHRIDPQVLHLPMFQVTWEGFLFDWDFWHGQEPVVAAARLAVEAAVELGGSMPNILLTSPHVGMGKSTLARLMAQRSGRDIVRVVAPVDVETLTEAALNVPMLGILLIEHIEEQAALGPHALMLLRGALDGHLRSRGQDRMVDDITVIGTTTRPERLPQSITDLFARRLDFEPYEHSALLKIVVSQTADQEALDVLDAPALAAIARSCQGSTAVCEQLVAQARDLATVLGRSPSSEELLDAVGVDEDGLSPRHYGFLQAVHRLSSTPPKGVDRQPTLGEVSAALRAFTGLNGHEQQHVEVHLERCGLLIRGVRGPALTAAGVEGVKTR